MRVDRNNAGMHDTAMDLICGVEVDRKDAESRGHYVDYEGERYWFCSNSCTTQFSRAPELCSNLTAAEDAEGSLRGERI